MAALLRLLPRHWDGKRLLQFLAGLVLLAFTIGGPASAPAGAVTPAAATTATSTAATTATVRASAAGPASDATVAAAVQRQTECQHDASGFERSAPAAHPAAPAGVAPGAHGSRAPPRA